MMLLHALKNHMFYIFVNAYFCNLSFAVLVLLSSCSFEINPDPKKSSVIKFFHLNLYGLTAHYFLKLFSIEAFMITHKFEIIYISISFSDSKVPQHFEIWLLMATHY